MVKRDACVVAAVLLAAACKPEFDDRPSQVKNYRVLAIQAEPAEWQRVVDPDTNQAKPATYRALVSSPVGTVDGAPLEWAFCTLPKPLTELNDISIKCFQNDPTYTQILGTGPETSAAVPENACRQFGPDVPEDTSFRPADPDVTGGYYQPLRVVYRPTPDLLIPSIAKVRIRCGLPGASQEQTQQYNRFYHLNSNPRIESVSINGQAVDTSAAGAPFALGPGQSVTIRVTWPACPLTDTCGDGTCGPTETKEVAPGQCEADCKVEKSCGGAERYLAYRLETRSLGETREVMRVSWFAAEGGGAFADDRTGRDAEDATNFTENTFAAPTTPGTYPVWAVLRDDRGGITWAAFRVVVQ